ncbi:MAG: FkbM family methyltransferase [Pseudomonadota bacterium]
MTTVTSHKIVSDNDAFCAETGAYVSPRAHVVRATHLGQPVYFTVDNPDDVIQSEHVQGRFYEPEELDIMRRFFPVGGRFLDIGANVGNHSVYMAKFLHASRIVLVEPNPDAIRLLESNILLNGLGGVCDRSRLGYGLSDGVADSAFIRVGRNNLGGARVKEGQGDVPLASGDQLLGDEVFDLIKIDVEGMEMKVLAGMATYLARHPTPIFIEVDKVNYEAFEAWTVAQGYTKQARFQRYRANTNFLIEPAA